MGVTIRSKHSLDYDMGYFTFGCFREDIENYVSENPRKGTISFLTQYDCEGKLTPKECRDMLQDIKDMEDNGKHYGYIGRGLEGCLTIPKFKDLLENCIKNRCNLKWF